jgi:hypothetical protein
MSGGQLECTARVHFPGMANLTEAAVTSAAAAVAPGFGRLRALCAALSAVADAGAGDSANQEPEATTAAAAVACGAAMAAAAAADSTAPLHVFSNPLYSVNTPKQVC